MQWKGSHPPCTDVHALDGVALRGKQATPNWSFNRTRYGKAAWPPYAQVDDASRGQATLPPRAG